MAEALQVVDEQQLLLRRRAGEHDLLLGEQLLPLRVRQSRQRVPGDDGGLVARVGQRDVRLLDAVLRRQLARRRQCDNVDAASDGLRRERVVCMVRGNR